MDEVRVAPAAEAGSADVEAVFRQPGDPGHCWCQWFRLTNREFDAATDDERRAALRAQLADERGPGLVAYRDGEPAGWAAVAPRAEYVRLARSQLLRGVPEPAGEVWAVSCFVVRPEHRRRGLARTLLGAAIGAARTGGAAVLEGYPVDPTARARTSAAELYHGTVGLFTDAGFAVVARPSAARAVVRLAL